VPALIPACAREKCASIYVGDESIDGGAVHRVDAAKVVHLAMSGATPAIYHRSQRRRAFPRDREVIAEVGGPGRRESQDDSRHFNGSRTSHAMNVTASSNRRGNGCSGDRRCPG